jgi:hypothetical protein
MSKPLATFMAGQRVIMVAGPYTGRTGKYRGAHAGAMHLVRFDGDASTSMVHGNDHAEPADPSSGPTIEQPSDPPTKVSSNGRRKK